MKIFITEAAFSFPKAPQIFLEFAVTYSLDAAWKIVEIPKSVMALSNSA